MVERVVYVAFTGVIGCVVVYGFGLPPWAMLAVAWVVAWELESER